MSDTQPVDKIDFWKDRIEKAPPEHKQYSVYYANEQLWNRINIVHKGIVQRNIMPGQSVLDAGCGYGRCSEWFPNNPYFGVDFSPDFIKMAKRDYPDKSFMVSDLKILPFNNKHFDWALCVSIKGMITGNLGAAVWEEMEKELKRVAKKILILEYGDAGGAMDNVKIL